MRWDSCLPICWHKLALKDIRCILCNNNQQQIQNNVGVRSFDSSGGNIFPRMSLLTLLLRFLLISRFDMATLLSVDHEISQSLLTALCTNIIINSLAIFYFSMSNLIASPICSPDGSSSPLFRHWWMIHSSDRFCNLSIAGHWRWVTSSILTSVTSFPMINGGPSILVSRQLSSTGWLGFSKLLVSSREQLLAFSTDADVQVINH